MNRKRLYKQTMVYWNPPTKSRGDDVYTEPIELCCRWLDKVERFVDSTGQEKTSVSVFYTDTLIELDAQAFEGTFADLSSGEEENPVSIPKARPIQKVDKIPSLRGGCFSYKGYL